MTIPCPDCPRRKSYIPKYGVIGNFIVVPSVLQYLVPLGKKHSPFRLEERVFSAASLVRVVDQEKSHRFNNLMPASAAQKQPTKDAACAKRSVDDSDDSRWED